MESCLLVGVTALHLTLSGLTKWLLALACVSESHFAKPVLYEVPTYLAGF
jgi:hypothetical protein